MNEPALVEVYRAKNAAQAHLMRKALADAGIHAIIENENLQGVLGEVPAWNAAPRIMVERTDAPIARAMLVALERSKRPASADERPETATCLACGARMPDEAEKCSKCGWTYNAGESEPILN